VYTSAFSVDADSFTGTNATVTGNIDGIGGQNNWLEVVSNGSPSGGARRTITLSAGSKNWRNAFLIFIPSTNVTCTQVRVSTQNSGSNVRSDSVVPALDTAFGAAYVFTTTTDFNQLFFQFQNSAGSVASNTNLDKFYIRSIELKQIGLTSELIASNAQSNTGQIFDTSGNKNHALLPASGATVVGRPVSQTREVRWTNTWAGTNELQYIGGVNQAILPANAYIESIIGTVSGATPHDIIIGDGSDTDRYVTITTGLAAGTTNFALAARTTDGTNLKLTVDPDTNSDMSIVWLIRYSVLGG
jgi:hypothetical protein